MAAAEAGRQFDLGNLRSPGERILLEMGCTLLSQVCCACVAFCVVGRLNSFEGVVVSMLRADSMLVSCAVAMPCLAGHLLLCNACPGLLQGALVREPGRLLLTDQRLYFQPLHPISGDAAVSSHPLPAVAAAARRRSSLRDLALEVRGRFGVVLAGHWCILVFAC